MRFFARCAMVLLGAAAAQPGLASDLKAELDRLFADERAFTWREDPLAATADGVRDYDDRLPGVTPADQARQIAADKDFLERLRAIDRGALSDFDAVSYDLFEFMVSQRVALGQYREWRTPLNSDSGFHANLLQLHDLQAPRTVKDYENYVARLNDVPRYFGENIANMRQGIAEGFVLPAEITPGISSVIDGAQYAKAEDSPFWIPFAEFPAAVPESERARLATAGRAAIEGKVIPAYAQFRDFFEKEYRPAARKTIGATELPAGEAYYADLVRYFTTLPDATARQIHDTGVAEVARIRAEMEAIVREVGFQGSFAEFLAFLRSDPQFYAKTPEQLLWHAAWITREIDGRMPEFFGRIPRAPYTVKPMPAAIAPNYTAGRYNPGPARRCRRVLGQHLRAEKSPALRAAGALAARGGARSPHPGRAFARARGRAAVPSQLLSACFRRGLGTVLGVPRGRDGHLSHALRALRPPDLRNVARRAPGRGYGHACFRLVAATGARLHDG
jgi:uncharacterized protein (DUF885 family)